MGLFAIAHALTVGKEGGNYSRLEVIGAHPLVL
jgi:hypothetical protein